MTTQKRLMAPALLLLLSLGCQPDGTIVDPKVVTDASAPLVASAGSWCGGERAGRIGAGVSP